MNGKWKRLLTGMLALFLVLSQINIQAYATEDVVVDQHQSYEEYKNESGNESFEVESEEESTGAEETRHNKTALMNIQTVPNGPSNEEDWVDEFYNNSFEIMTSADSWVADGWTYEGGVYDNGAWLTNSSARTGTYSQAINDSNNNFTITQTVPVEPGIYEVHLFVWADKALGDSTLTVNGNSTKIHSNGAFQIDGALTWDEVVVKGIAAPDGWLEATISIQNAPAGIAGFLDDISFTRIGDYIEISPDASDGALLNGDFDTLDHWISESDENVVVVQGGGVSGMPDDNKLAYWKDEPFTGMVYQDIKNLENGEYLVSAQVYTDTNSECYIYANNFFGSPSVEKVLPTGSIGWQSVSVKITVENGCLRVGTRIVADADGWLAVDEFRLTRIKDEEESADQFIKNSGFEEGTDCWELDGTIVENDSKKGHSLEHANTGAQNSYQIVENLENGYYTLTGRVQNSGGQKEAYLFASEFGTDKQAMTAIPRSNFPYDEDGTWKKVTVRGIHVTNGKIKIGLHTDSQAEQYARLDNLHLVKDDQDYELLKGGDISELTYVEDFGGKYYNESGIQVDPVEFLAESGWNIARIRVYNNPGKGRGTPEHYIPEGYSDVEDALRLAKRAKDAGLQIQLSFHYSDYWTNPGTQITPKEWQDQIVGLDEADAVDKLEELIYEFTEDVLEKMTAQGTTPEYVSIGNEIRAGMLFGHGYDYGYNYGRTNKWDNLARFLNAGAKAVRDKASDSKVIIHLDDGGNVSSYTSFFDAAEARNVDYDIIGTSYYPYWTQKNAYQFADFCKTISTRYEKPLLCMETGFNWTANNGADETGQLENNGPYGDCDSSTPELQRDFVIELFNAMKGVEDGMCMGALYWDPIMIYTDGAIGWAYFEADDTLATNGVDNTTLFDFDGIALPVLDAFRYNSEGQAVKKPAEPETEKPSETEPPTETEKPVSNKILVSKLSIAGIKNQKHTGKTLCPKLVVKNDQTVLKEGTDYTLSYKNNVNPGKAMVTITGKNNYAGSANKYFEILAAKGKTYKVGNYKYKVTVASEKQGKVTLTKPVKKNLKSVIVPAVVKIGNYKYKVTEIAAKTFKNNGKLTKVTIGKDVKTIGANAFTGASKLTKITITSKVLKTVGKNAFSKINSKATIKVPSSKLKKYKKLMKGKGQSATVKIKSN